MRLYTAGPMTYIPQYNYPAFDAMADSLRRAGHDVVSPSELDSEEDRAAALRSTNGDPDTYTGKSTWGDFLARDVKLLSDDGIQGVVVLPGWAQSRGARLETYVARLAGLPIYTWDATYKELRPVPDLTLFRAWCATDIIINHTYGREVPA